MACRFLKSSAVSLLLPGAIIAFSHVSKTLAYHSTKVSVAEWLRRQTRNLLGSPAQVQILSLTFVLKLVFVFLFFASSCMC
ncbi:hypothetical protein BDV30DRAFT_216749, partial [Aspergillus minisclerotigenes]